MLLKFLIFIAELHGFRRVMTYAETCCCNMIAYRAFTIRAQRHLRSHVRVSTHVQNPPHERKIARASIIINHAIAHAK